MPFLQFIAASVGAAVVISFASLVWPKVSSQPRPAALTKVRDIVVETEVGRNVANVLGVTDETNVTPVSVGTLVASEGSTLVSGIGQAAQNAVTSRLIEQLVGQFDKLPQNQKEEFQKRICQPGQ